MDKNRITIGMLSFFGVVEGDNAYVRIFGAAPCESGQLVTREEWQSLEVAAASLSNAERRAAADLAEIESLRKERDEWKRRWEATQPTVRDGATARSDNHG